MNALMEAAETRCLRSVCDITKCDRVRNERNRELTGVNETMNGTGHNTGGIAQVLRKIDIRRLLIYESSMSEVRTREIPRKRYVDGKKEAIKFQSQAKQKYVWIIGQLGKECINQNKHQVHEIATINHIPSVTLLGMLFVM